MPHLLAQHRKLLRDILIDSRLMRDNFDFLVSRRIGELDGHEALAGRMLQIFLDALVAGIVRNHQQKSLMRLDRLAALFYRQNPPMIRQRMDQHRRVLARLDHFVEVANRAAPHGLSQRTVNPHRLVGLNQKASDQVAAGEILVTRDCDQLVGAVGERR